MASDKYVCVCACPYILGKYIRMSIMPMAHFCDDVLHGLNAVCNEMESFYCGLCPHTFTDRDSLCAAKHKEKSIACNFSFNSVDSIQKKMSERRKLEETSLFGHPFCCPPSQSFLIDSVSNALASWVHRSLFITLWNSEFFHFLVNMSRSQRLTNFSEIIQHLLRSEAGSHTHFCCLSYNAFVRMELVCLTFSVEHRSCVKTPHCVLNVKCASTVHMARLTIL